MFSIEKIIGNCKYSHLSYRKNTDIPGMNLRDFRINDHSLHYERSYDVFYRMSLSCPFSMM